MIVENWILRGLETIVFFFVEEMSHDKNYCTSTTRPCNSLWPASLALRVAYTIAVGKVKVRFSTQILQMLYLLLLCQMRDINEIRMSRGSVLVQNRLNPLLCTTQLGPSDKGCAIKGLVVRNGLDLEHWDLLKGLALGYFDMMYGSINIIILQNSAKILL